MTTNSFLSDSTLLRQLRKEINLNQEALAHSSGVSKRTVEYAERDASSVKPRTFNMIRVALGADKEIFDKEHEGRLILSIRLIAPFLPGDITPVFENSDTANVKAPDIHNIQTAAIARDLCRLFEQVMNTFADLGPADKVVYIRELSDLIAQLRDRGWITRIGHYTAVTHNLAEPNDERQSSKTNKIAVLRIRPVSSDGPVVFISSPTVLSLKGADIVQPSH